MGIKARWHGQPYHDFANKRWLVTFEVEATPCVYDKLKDKPLSLDIKEYKEKRSLNANAYFHTLVDKIAHVMGLSHTEVHNRMIAEYGQVDKDVNYIILKDIIPWLKLDYMHLRPTTNTKVLDDGQLYRVFQVMRGSHTYDTKEMATLIDGVVQEAKQLGIETLTPNELERMKDLWTV